MQSEKFYHQVPLVSDYVTKVTLENITTSANIATNKQQFLEGKPR